MYKKFTDAEKKKFLNIFIESIEIFPEEQYNGRLIKCENVTHISRDGETTVDIVVLSVKQ